jgi:hypothetical protein
MTFSQLIMVYVRSWKLMLWFVLVAIAINWSLHGRLAYLLAVMPVAGIGIGVLSSVARRSRNRPDNGDRQG